VRPEPFTITTFWADWTVMPLMLGAAWLTLRWALADWRKASRLQAKGAILPGWAVFPLAISAAGFVLLGLSMLVKAPYWEHRGLWVGQMLLLIGCLIGAALILLGFLRGGSRFGIAPSLLTYGSGCWWPARHASQRGYSWAFPTTLPGFLWGWRAYTLSDSD
jgi:hypothetical protein